VAGSAALFGPETWLAFWDNLAHINRNMAEGQVPILKMTSLFATLRVAGVDAGTAYALHAVLAAAVAAVVAWVWHRRRATAASAAVLVVGALLVSPHVYDYDLAVLAVAIATLGWAAYSSEPLPGERAALMLAWFTPMIVLGSVTYVGVQLGTVCLLIVFAVAVRRALTQSDALDPAL
jgi:multidrug transporter EmrE-like cation transporter